VTEVHFAGDNILAKLKLRPATLGLHHAYVVDLVRITNLSANRGVASIRVSTGLAFVAIRDGAVASFTDARFVKEKTSFA
jgi:hypothetical protein